MALTKAQVREILSAAGVASDKMDSAVDRIMDGHITSINALREDVQRYKGEAEKLPGVQKELDDLKKASVGADDYKAKYEKEHGDFEAYKAGIKEKETTALKDKLYRAILKDEHIDEKRYDAIMRVTDLKGHKVKDDKFEDEAAIRKSIKETWADFAVTEKTEPSGNPANPPGNSGDGGKGESRAAQLAAQYSANLYGAPKTDK